VSHAGPQAGADGCCGLAGSEAGAEGSGVELLGDRVGVEQPIGGDLAEVERSPVQPVVPPAGCCGSDLSGCHLAGEPYWLLADVGRPESVDEGACVSRV
jgi:hypothetical protein